MISIRPYTILIFLCCSIHLLCAQNFPELRFQHLTEKDGLSNNKVLSVTQDKEGFIWIGTMNGLNRFEGYRFSKFFHDNRAPRSLPSNMIFQIRDEGKDSLWLSTSEGIAHFSTSTGESINFPIAPDEGSNGYMGFVREGNAQLWAYNKYALFNLDPDSKKVKKKFSCPKGLAIHGLYFDQHHRCWVSTWGNGIYLFSPPENKWTPYDDAGQHSICYPPFEYTIENTTYLIFTNERPALILVNEATLRSRTYTFDFKNPSPLSFASPFVDRQSILWVPTSNGIYYASLTGNLFDILPVTGSEKGDPIPGSFVYNMREEDSSFWISRRYKGGLSWYTRDWKLKKFWPKLLEESRTAFPADSGATTEAFDYLRAGNSLFITTEVGIVALDPATSRTKIYSPKGLPLPPRLRTIVPEKADKWWIRSFDHGVYLFNPITRQFTGHYVTPLLNYLFMDRQRRIYASSTEGLLQYDAATDGFREVKLLGPPFPSRIFYGICQDAGGLLWVATENGVCGFDPDRRMIVKSFPDEHTIGLALRICTDDSGNVWFNGITSGYWCWLRKQDQLVHFGYDLGLPENDESIVYKASDGLVYAGGLDALVRFYPHRLMSRDFTVRVKITGVNVNDQPPGRGMIPSADHPLLLQPDENNLGVDFAIINYELINNDRYFYKLMPGDREWRPVENGHLWFHSLPPGAYTLEVKGANTLIGNRIQTDSLHFVIRAYWYQRAWFRAFLLLLVVLTLALVVARRLRTIRKESYNRMRQAAFRQKIAETEMQALRAQMNPHFIFNSLNSIENFMLRNDRLAASEYLNKFSRLIRTILDSSRSELAPFARDLEAIQLYVELEQLRFDHKFSYKTIIDPTLLSGDYYVPPLLIQPYVENAVVHGLSYSGSPHPELLVTATLSDGAVVYTIRDNGIGRAKAREYNAGGRPGHKSLGLRLTQERIHIFNKITRTKGGGVKITDLYGDDGEPCGTLVELKIQIE